MAAILACRSEVSQPGADESTAGLPRRTVLDHWGAALSHRGAAALWGMLPPSDKHIDVSVSGIGGKRKHRGVHVHRSRTLAPEMVTSQLGIPVTTPARTIADLRRAARTRGCPAVVSPRELRRAIRQAEVLGLPTGAERETKGTRSDLELAFLRLCHRHRLPSPEVNVRVGPHLVDFLWRSHQLIVETDGYRYHRGRAAFERDRDRDLGLRALGYDVVRLSESQVAKEPERIAAILKTALRRC